MALFGFGKKKEPMMPPPGMGAPIGPPYFGPPPMPQDMPLPIPEQGPPVDQVLMMRQQGLTNNQAMTSLQRAGYSQQQIFDAMNQADIKGGIEAMPPGEFEAPAQGMGMQSPYPPQGMAPPQEYSSEGQYPSQGPQMMGQSAMGPPPETVSQEKIEEVAESIIDEKWTDFATNINKVIEWKEKVESRMDQTDQKIKDLNDNFDKLHNAVLGKIEEYDKNILNVGTEVKAMEKVFQQVLPTFTENINELGRITKRIKSPK